MSRQPTPPVAAKDLQGFKYFALVAPLLERLHHSGTVGDKAGNRRLFFDQYAALLLLYFLALLPSVWVRMPRGLRNTWPFFRGFSHFPGPGIVA